MEKKLAKMISWGCFRVFLNWVINYKVFERKAMHYYTTKQDENVIYFNREGGREITINA